MIWKRQGQAVECDTGVLFLLPGSPHSAYDEIFEYFISLNEMALLDTFTLDKQNQIKSWEFKQGLDDHQMIKSTH